MSYTIEKTWMEHDTGTKFYQVMRVQESSGGPSPATVTIGHYGPMSAAKGLEFSRPAACGQCEIKAGDSYRDKCREKQKRGYVEKRVNTAGCKTADLEATLTELLGSSKAKDVLLKLGQTATPVRQTDKPKPAPQTERSAAETPAGWGDW